jgi:ADP-ribosylglycohydrolase
MTDAGIKKATVLKQSLPPVNSDNGYLVRYRIVSEDRNRYSHWSPIVTLTGNSPEAVAGSVIHADGIVNAVWGDEAQYPDYDVFVGFDSATPAYHGTTSVHNYSFLNEGTEEIEVIIQIASSSKTLSNTLEIYSETVLI